MLQLCGEYGLRNKREILRVSRVLAQLRKSARELLTLDEKDTKRIFEGGAILRRCQRLGLLSGESVGLDNVLSLKVKDFMDRRLQTLVLKKGHAKSIHHARVLIRQKHIRVGKQVVDVPSYLVRVDSEKHIDFAVNSPFAPGGKPGRKARASLKKKSGGDDE